MVSKCQALESNPNCGKMQTSPQCEGFSLVQKEIIMGESHDTYFKKIDHAYRYDPFHNVKYAMAK